MPKKEIFKKNTPLVWLSNFWGRHGLPSWMLSIEIKWFIYNARHRSMCIPDSITWTNSLWQYPWFFAAVSFQMCPRRMHSHIGCTCLTFLHCEFLNESSNCLPQKMRSHIGCIYLTFLHCAFSYVSSKRLSEKRQSHIGCICSTFLHCEFSYVSLNGLSERMHNYIGCICSTFLRCAFSNVSSNRLHEKKHTRIGSICILCCAFYDDFASFFSQRLL